MTALANSCKSCIECYAPEAALARENLGLSTGAPKKSTQELVRKRLATAEGVRRTRSARRNRSWSVLETRHRVTEFATAGTMTTEVQPGCCIGCTSAETKEGIPLTPALLAAEANRKLFPYRAIQTLRAFSSILPHAGIVKGRSLPLQLLRRPASGGLAFSLNDR
jgi:hypothetical protein